MFTPYKPCHKHTCFLVKVFDSISGTTYWINRSFRNVKAVRNSYIHQKYWQGTVYYVYKYPSCLFVEAITYTDNKTRIILDNPEVKTIAGKYKEPCNKGEQTMCCVDKLITALQHPEEIDRIEEEDKRKELLKKSIKPSKNDLNNMYMKCDNTSHTNFDHLDYDLDYEPFLRQHFEVGFDGDKQLGYFVSKCTFEKQKNIDDSIKSINTLKIQIIATQYSLNWFNNLDYNKTYKISYTVFSPDGERKFEIKDSYRLKKSVIDSQYNVNETLPIMVVFESL